MRIKDLALRGTLTVAATTLAVSVTHLERGIELATGIPTWEGWALAGAIDLGMIAAETAALATSATRWTRLGVSLGLTLSGLFNCLAFAEHAVGDLHTAIAYTLGVVVPVSIYALTQTAHNLSNHRRPTTKKRRSK